MQKECTLFGREGGVNGDSLQIKIDVVKSVVSLNAGEKDQILFLSPLLILA